MSSRRRFLQKSTAAAALLGLPAGAVRAENRASVSADSLRISILSYAFHGLLREGKMDLFGYLESVKHRYGLGAADIWNGFLKSTDEAYIQKVREGLEERELDLSSIAVDEAYVWDDDAEIRERHYANAMAHLNAARILQPNFVRIDAGGEGEDWTEEQFDHIVMRFREYAQYAYDHGFKCGAENHWGPETNWKHLKRLTEAVDHPGFGLSCHIGAWRGTDEEKDQADREVAPWVCTTHIDWRICTGPMLREKLANLWDAGYDGYYCVEHHSGKDEYREVAIQLALVRNELELMAGRK